MNLLISASPANVACANAIEEMTEVPVKLCSEIARAAEVARGGEYNLVIFDRASVPDEVLDEEIFRHAPLSIPVVINSALMNTRRILTEISGAISRVERERHVAMRQADLTVRNQVKDETTGILVASGLALKSDDTPAFVHEKLQDIYQLASRMRGHFELVQ